MKVSTNVMTVKVSTNSPSWPLVRQTSKRSGKWGNTQFFVDDPSINECDCWVVLGGLTNEESAACNPKHTIFVCTEPPDIHHYSSKFLLQFYSIVTQDRKLRHPYIMYNHPALPWFIGGKYVNSRLQPILSHDYDELISMPVPKKKQKIVGNCIQQN